MWAMGHTSINIRVCARSISCNVIIEIKSTINVTPSYSVRKRATMGHISIETRTRVIHLWKNGFLVQDIVSRLAEEDVSVSRAALYMLLKKYSNCHTVADLRRTP